MTVDLRSFDLLAPVDRGQWEEAIAATLGPGALERLTTAADAAPAVKPLGEPRLDRTAIDGRPAGRAWSIVQRVVVGDPIEANAAILEALAGGADALDVTVKDPERTPGSGGQIETARKTVRRAFDGVYLDMVSLHFTQKSAPQDLIVELLAVAAAAGIDAARLTVHRGFDPVVALAQKHRKPRISSDIFATMREAIPSGGCETTGGTVLSTRGHYWHALGASEPQQIAITLATAVALLRLSSSEDWKSPDVRQLASRLEFRLVADQNQMMTIAKFRALRRLWALILDAADLPQTPAFLHAETAWRMMTRRDPWVNILRTTIATFAAAVGGADAVTVLPHTAVVGAPDAAARRLARNIQLVLMEESNLARVADPSAGAGAVEDLTDALAEAAWAEFQTIEREGGIVASLADGGLLQRIATADAAQRDAVARRRLRITGTNTYPLLSESVPAVAAGPLPEPPAPGARRLSEPFEALRDRSDARLARGGRRPAVFLANLGPPSAFTARATFAKGLFEAGGIEAIGREGYEDPAALAAAFRAAETPLVCLASDNATYDRLAASAVAALQAAGAEWIYFAGRARSGAIADEEALRAAGVTGHVHEGMDALALLEGLMDALDRTLEPDAAGVRS